ncbi:MAG: hypothetical protein MPW15_22560 [Candidatus Manganitrophus sp.]|nr:hypothetical protein [Candidatus Manganitrophus sp.]
MVFLVSEKSADAQEFVIFTKTQDQRFPACSSASQAQCERFNSSQPACTINIFSCRGYDPTRNISSGLNTPINCPDLQTNCPAPADGALELFIHLGPGEATGNMHGRIQGANGNICKEISSVDPSSELCAGIGNLNLGIEKYNPKSQDDNAPCVGLFNASSATGTGNPNPAEDCTNPTGNGSNTAGMTSADGFHGFSEQFARNDDFFPGAIEHAGFKFDVSFKWMDQNTLATCNQNRSGMVQHSFRLYPCQPRALSRSLRLIPTSGLEHGQIPDRAIKSFTLISSAGLQKIMMTSTPHLEMLPRKRPVLIRELPGSKRSKTRIFPVFQAMTMK